MSPGEAVIRLSRLQDAPDGVALLTEYSADLQTGSGCSAERAAEIAREDLGWLLGELNIDERRRALAYLPDNVAHPLLGRRVDRPTDDELIELGQLWVLGNLADRAEAQPTPEACAELARVVRLYVKEKTP